MAGERPNCSSLTELRFLPRFLQRGAEPLLYDSGPSEARVVIFGATWCAQALGRAQMWEADGTFKTAPTFRGQVYMAHAHCVGFVAPFAYALLPNKTSETYAITWAAIRANIGQEAADLDRLGAMNFDVASIGAAPAAFPGIRFEGCYFHLAQSVRRQAQQLGLQRKYASDAEFQLWAMMIPALAFPPVDGFAAGFDHIETLFADGGQPLCAYFEANYIGRRVGGARRQPRFG